MALRQLILWCFGLTTALDAPTSMDLSTSMIPQPELGTPTLRHATIHETAVLGVTVKATIKEVASDGFVTKTLDRKFLWEMQTPQVIEPELLRRGFELVEREHLEVYRGALEASRVHQRR